MEKGKLDLKQAVKIDLREKPSIIELFAQKDIIQFIGKDGRRYSSFEDLQAADEAYMREHFQFIGKDSREYLTSEDLVRANKKYFQKTNFYIVYDAIEGRREIAPGTGLVRICVGFKIESGASGKRTEVPVYRTEVFWFFWKNF